MAILINDNYKLSAKKPFDDRYLNISTPWASCAEVIAAIPTYRYSGLTVNIAGEEYWWKDGLGDNDLVPKIFGGTSNLSGATNGLQLLCSNTYIGLGGELTQDTTIYGSYSLSLGSSASGLTAISGVTPIFNIQDSEGHSNINFVHDQDTPHFDVCLFADSANSNADITLDVDINNGCFIAGTAPNTICCSSLSLLTTDNNEAIYNVHSTNNVMHYIKESCIASSKLSCEALISRSVPTDNIKTVMNYDNRSHTFIKDDSTIFSILSGGTARYGSNVTLNNDCDLAHKWYVDNASGSISGSNGLTRVDDNITLGGTLTGNTCVGGSGSNYGLTFSGSSYYTIDNTSVGSSNINLLAQGQVCLEGCNVSALIGGATFDIRDLNGDEQIQFGTTGDVRFCNLNAKTTETNLLYINSSTGQLVTGTSISITTANNGICKIGDNFILGGDLTGNTTIDGVSAHNLSLNNINNLSIVSSTGSTCATSEMLLRTPSLTIHNGVDNVMNITSSCNKLTDNTNSEGFVYAGNYCAVGKTNPRWIPDNAYVTGLTTGSVSTASNGLTLTSNDVKLGGSLCEITNICLGGGTAYNFNIKNSGATTCAVSQFSSTAINLSTTNVISPFQTGKISTDINNVIISSGFGNCHSCIDLSNSVMNINICGGANASLNVIDNSSTPRGIEYAADYSSTFSNCSLVTKEYVTGITNTLETQINNLSGITAQGITGATNGICKTGQDIKLGGTLTESTTLDIASGSYFAINETPTIFFDVYSQSGDCSTNMYHNLNGGSLIYLSSSDSSVGAKYTNNLEIRENNICFKNLWTNDIAGACASFSQYGFAYDIDYSGNWTNRHLVDKGYVDNAITNNVSGITSTAITGATNGLTKVGQDVILTGALTQDSGLLGDGYDFSVGTSSRRLDIFNVNTSGATTFINGDANSGVNRSVFDMFNNGVSMGSVTSGETGSNISIDGDNMLITDNINSKGLEYDADYSTNGATNPRWIPDIGYVSGYTIVHGTNIYTSLSNPTGLTGNNNILFGTGVGDNMTTGDNNIGLGRNALISNISGDYNIAIGNNSSQSRTSGLFNTAIGYQSLKLNTSGNTNVAIGAFAGDNNINGSCNVFIGPEAGYGELGSCKLYIDNSFRGSEISGRECSLVYGEFNPTSSNQLFRINSQLELPHISGCSSSNILYYDDTNGRISYSVAPSGSTPNTFSNGLTKVGSEVKLGGSISQSTEICGNTQTLSFGTAANPLGIFCTSSCFGTRINNNVNGDKYFLLNNTSGVINAEGTSSSSRLDVSESNGILITLSGTSNAMYYNEDYSANYNNRSLVDKEYVDNKANTVNVCHINSAYTTLRNDELIAVSGISTNEINLYGTPVIGQRITVVDVCGNAFVEPIVVNGNGYNINDAVCSTINTDYGSVTFVFNGIFWSAVAFIN